MCTCCVAASTRKMTKSATTARMGDGEQRTSEVRLRVTPILIAGSPQSSYGARLKSQRNT